VGRILFRFAREWILRDDLLPFVGGPDEKLRCDSEPLFNFRVEKALELRGRFAIRSKCQIPAVQQRSRVFESEFLQKRDQIRHRDSRVATNVDAAQKSDVTHYVFCDSFASTPGV